MNRTFTYLITQKDSPCTVESYLKKRGYSHPILVQLKKTQNGILVNQKWAYVKTILNPDDKLEIHLEETASSEHIVPVELPFSIVYEDAPLKNMVKMKRLIKTLRPNRSLRDRG